MHKVLKKQYSYSLILNVKMYYIFHLEKINIIEYKFEKNS